MNEEQKRQVAIFRFGVIHDFVGGVRLDRGEQQRLLREKCQRRWSIPHSQRTRLTRSTILRWIQRYKQGNGKLESLYPTERSDCGVSRGLDEESSLALVQLRKESPRIPVTDLIKTIYKRRLVPPGKVLSLSTVYRLLHFHHLIRVELTRKTGASSRRNSPTICGKATRCTGLEWMWTSESARPISWPFSTTTPA